MEQRTPEWHQVRLGKLTASRIADATARTKTGWGASRANYMAELLIERLTGQPAARPTNAAMEWGAQMEPEAITVFEFERNVSVEPVAFIEHPRIRMSGASPDGLIGDDGMLEIKCPNSATHIDTWLSTTVDEKYLKQMQWQLACTSRAWCDFMSYDPRMPLELRSKIIRIPRDDKMIAKLENEATEFLAELDAKHKALLDAAHGRTQQSLKEALQDSVNLLAAG